MLSMSRLEWGGCFSYGPDNYIDLNGANITQLIGENGSGKSSIPLILQEVTYNKNSKGVKKADISNREIGDGKYWIKLYFELQDEEYHIHLIRASTLKVKLYKGSEDISSHTATDTFKTIEGLFGIDFKVFVQLIYQSVTDGLSFLTATDTVRKKFLIDLFSLDEYSKYFEIFKALLQEVTKEIASIKGSISALEKMAEKSANLPKYKDLNPVPPEVEYPTEIGTLEANISNVLSLNKKIQQNNQLKSILRTISYDSELVSLDMVNTDDLRLQVGELTSKVNTAKALIAKMNKLNDKCPTCGHDLDISKEKSLKAEAEQELLLHSGLLEETQGKLRYVADKNAKIAAAKKARDEKEDLYQRIDHGLSSELLDVEDLKTKIEDLKESYKQAKKEYDAVIAYNNSAETHNQRITIMKEQREETLIEIEIETIRLEKILHKQSIYEILKKTFSTNGLVAYKLENLVKDIEEAANDYLLELSDGRFSLMFSISGDKLNVTLIDNNNEIDISALSSGELARVNIATLLAIRKIMSYISKTQINVLFLDEVINVLDEYGREKLIEVLLEEKSLNTFLVSHGWSHPLLSKISVQKTNGISQLKEQ